MKPYKLSRKEQEDDYVINKVLEILKMQARTKHTIFLVQAVKRAGIDYIDKTQLNAIREIFKTENPDYSEYRIYKADVPISQQSEICTVVFTKEDIFDIKYKFHETLSVSSETTGEKICRLRKEMGMSRAEFAKKSGVIYRTLQSYENDERNIMHATADVVNRIAATLNITIEELLS